MRKKKSKKPKNPQIKTQRDESIMCIGCKKSYFHETGTYLTFMWDHWKSCRSAEDKLMHLFTWKKVDKPIDKKT